MAGGADSTGGRVKHTYVVPFPLRADVQVQENEERKWCLADNRIADTTSENGVTPTQAAANPAKARLPTR